MMNTDEQMLSANIQYVQYTVREKEKEVYVVLVIESLNFNT